MDYKFILLKKKMFDNYKG